MYVYSQQMFLLNLINRRFYRRVSDNAHRYCTTNTTCLQDWDRQNPTQIVTEMCGFVTILSGTFLLHKTKDMVDGMVPLLPSSGLHMVTIFGNF